MTDKGTDVFIIGDEDDYITLSDDFSMEDDDTITVDLSNTIYSDLTAPLMTTSITGAGGGYWTSPLSTTLGTGTISATASPYSSTSWTTYNQPQVLKVEGNAEFNGELKIKGVNLDERLNAIEERLGILRPNNDLEGKWEKLKKLGEEYRRLEKEILEGEQIWDMLKK